VLLRLVHIARLHAGEGEAVHGLRVLGIALEGPTQKIEDQQAVALGVADLTLKAFQVM